MPQVSPTLGFAVPALGFLSLQHLPSSLLPQRCFALLALAPTGLGLGGGCCLDLQQREDTACSKCCN